MTRAISVLGLVLGAALALPSGAGAQDYPTRTVKIIVPFAAGGSADAVPRVVADWLSRKWGHPIVIENRTGAAGNIGAEAAFKGGAGWLHIALRTAAAAGGEPEPLSEPAVQPGRVRGRSAVLARVPNALVVNPNKVTVKTVPEFIALAKSNPGKLTTATNGNGGTQHLTSEMFQMMADVKLQHVPYRGSAPALQDLVAGNVDLMVRQSRCVARAGEGRTAQAARGRDTQTHGRVAGRSDHRRDHSGLQLVGVVRRRGPAQDAAGGRQQAQRRHQRSAARSRREEETRPAFVGDRRRHAEATAAFMREEVARWGNVIKQANIKGD